MKTLALIAGLALASGGCFTSWALAEGAGQQKLLDESVRESAVPIAGAREALEVRLPLAPQYEPQVVAATPTAIGVPTTPPTPPVKKPLAVVCEVTQRGDDTVYHSAFRYGSTWKKTAAAFFVLEAATAALIYASDTKNPSTQVAAAAVALDALGTGIIAFAPRTEVYRTERRPDVTVVRQDCPDGLALDIGGESFPVDAAGRVGELGEAALDEWMRAPRAPVGLTLAGQDARLPLGADDVCGWNLLHHPEARCVRRVMRVDVAVTLAVPLGTLTRAE